MPGYTAEEAFDLFNSNGGEYGGGWNNPNAFASEEEWSKFKHMVPQAAKKAFREKVAGNENRAIEGLMQGKTREEMGITNVKEHGKALYNRLGAGLGTGLDMGRAYDWNGGTALNVGTSDLAKRGIERRGITGDERQRYADFSRAGSPEAFWSAYRQNQVQGEVNAGNFTRGADGRLYNDPNNDASQRTFYDNYGNITEGPGAGGSYNWGRGPMGNGTNLGGPNMGGGSAAGAPSGYTPGSYTSPVPSAPHAPSSGATTPPSFNLPSTNTGVTGGAFGTGSLTNTPNFNFSAGQGKGPQAANGGLTNLLAGKSPGAIYAAGGYSAPVQPVGPLPDGGTPMVVHPDEQVTVTPAAVNPNLPFPIAQAHAAQQQSGPVTHEIGPGGSASPAHSPFGTNPVPLPTGNGLVPGGSSTSGGTGGSNLPPLGGVTLPGQIPLGNSNPLTAPGGQGLAGQAGYDNSGQRFNYNRAVGEYGGAQALEGGLLGIYGDILGFDPATGAQRGASDSNNRSFAYLAPQAQRVAGDADALVKRLEATLPPGGERDAAIAQALRGAQSDISGARQGLMQQALTGVSELAQSKKQFDPQYTGANQSLLDAYGNLRGQDLSTMLGSRGQDITGMLGARGQDVQWGLGQAGLQQQEMQNLWNSYLQGRGQDMDLYSTTRGQDISQLIARQQAQAQKDAANKGFWGNLFGTVGGLAGAFLPGLGGGGNNGGASGGW